MPSSAARTLVVTALSFAGLVASQVLMPGLSTLGSVGAPRWIAVVPSLTWSSTVTALAMFASKVIYGLQERVFEARRLGQYTLDEKISSPQNVGAKSDLYSLGAVAYYLLSGGPVFEGSNVIEVCGHHLHTPPVPLSQRASQRVPSDLETIILQCLAKDPGARPASAQHLAESLRRCADASAWSEVEAQSWWRANKSLAEPAHPQRPSAVSRTLHVDLEARRQLHPRRS